MAAELLLPITCMKVCTHPAAAVAAAVVDHALSSTDGQQAPYLFGQDAARGWLIGGEGERGTTGKRLLCMRGGVVCSFGLSLRGATLRAGFAIEIGRINDGRHIGEIGERGKSGWSAFLVDSWGPPVRQARAKDFEVGLRRRRAGVGSLFGSAA